MGPPDKYRFSAEGLGAGRIIDNLEASSKSTPPWRLTGLATPNLLDGVCA
jgi:hypothetical protein